MEESEVVPVADGGDVPVDCAVAEDPRGHEGGGGDAAEVVFVETYGEEDDAGKSERGGDDRHGRRDVLKL